MSTWTTEDGSEIYFESFGGQEKNKPVILMLPGLLGAIRTQWRNFVQPLTSDFRIILMDLRGHGRSTNKADRLDARQMMEDIFGLLDYLQIEQVHVVGYSLGGYLGLMMAYTQSIRVKSVIAHATKFYWTKESVQKMNIQLNPQVMAEKAPAYADQLVQDHGVRIWRGLVRQGADLVQTLLQNGLTEQMINKIQCPVLISVGAKDELVQLAEAQRLSMVLPQGELIVLPGVRHPLQTLRFMPLLPMMQHFCLNS
jgi:pimeloyl-ACP methyl ester carboxylesterase